MLVIRLTRMGAKKQPFYRVVVAEKSRARDGRFVEILGTYNPLKEPAEIKLNYERVEHWLKQGAQPSATVRSLFDRPRPSLEVVS